MNILEIETQVVHLVASDNIEAAIELLLLHFQEHERIKQVVLFSSQYHALQKDKSMGVIEWEEEQRRLNQLRINLLEFIKQEVKVITNVIDPKQTEAHYLLSLARIAVLSIINNPAYDATQCTISNVYKWSGIKSRKYIAAALYEMERDELAEKFKVGKTTCWKLTKKGKSMARTVEKSVLFQKKEV